MVMLLPARTKYAKVQKGRIYGNAKGGAELAFGTFGIQVLERGRITAAQLEAARVAINRHLKRKGKMWLRVSRKNRLRVSLPKPVWERVREAWNIG